MTGASLRIPQQIGCLDTGRVRATLISTAGFYCDAWQASRVVLRDGRRYVRNVVIKHHRQPCTLREAQIYERDYQMLRAALGAMVPKAIFVQTRVDGEVNVVAFARAVTRWFNIANPAFEEEALPLLSRLGKARAQLRDFIDAARGWYAGPDRRVIDLWGVDNLVLDNRRNVRYLDSFNVFFYPDMDHVIGDASGSLDERVGTSLRRLEYLEYLLQATERA